MKTILPALFCCFFLSSLHAQDEALCRQLREEGDQLARKKEYADAINRYWTAMIVGPETIQIDPMTGKYIGRVKWYNTKKGYGFIVRGAAEEIFFHKSATVGEVEEFEEGQWVLYDVETTNKGPEASDVEPYTGEPLL